MSSRSRDKLRDRKPSPSASQYVTDKENRKRYIEDDYIVCDEKQVGEPGQFGRVVIGIRKDSRESCAVKIINKTRFFGRTHQQDYMDDFRREITILKELDHPNIVRFYDVYETHKDLMIVQELCCGGELFDRIAARAVKGVGYTESLASKILKQIVLALEYMHRHGIAHCDLKPSNIIFTSKSERAQLKVIDFGYAQRIPPWKRHLVKRCGTPFYTAPEILKGKYNKEADMWAVGIIMFALFFGYTPFQKVGDDSYSINEQNKIIYRRIREGFKGLPRAHRISSSASHLIRHLLVTDVKKRYTSGQALMHQWFEQASDEDALPISVLHSMQKQNSMNNFTVAVLAAFKKDVDPHQTYQLRKYFKQFDTNGDGYISMQELKRGLDSLTEGNELHRLRSREVETLFKKIDLDHDQRIQFDEFLTMANCQQLIGVYERCNDLFHQLDVDDNGYLDKNDVPNLIRTINSDPLVRRLNIKPEQILGAADLNNDGAVSFNEFLYALHPELTPPELRAKFDRLYDENQRAAAGGGGSRMYSDPRLGARELDKSLSQNSQQQQSSRQNADSISRAMRKLITDKSPSASSSRASIRSNPEEKPGMQSLVSPTYGVESGLDSKTHIRGRPLKNAMSTDSELARQGRKKQSSRKVRSQHQQGGGAACGPGSGGSGNSYKLSMAAPISIDVGRGRSPSGRQRTRRGSNQAGSEHRESERLVEIPHQSSRKTKKSHWWACSSNQGPSEV